MNDLYIALYRGSSSETVTIQKYLDMDGVQRAAVAPNFQHITINLVIDDCERLADRLSLGPLDSLVPQFELARQQLLDRKPALIRSGVLDVPAGNYLFFEPIANSDQVWISVITLQELPTRIWFPNGGCAASLYQLVEAERDQLIAFTRHQNPRLPVELSIDSATLIAALAREAAAGNKLLNGG